MRKLSRQNVYDILLGAALVGTGGGGSLDEGIRIVDEAFDDGCEFILAEPNEIPDDALVGTPYGCGSISPLTEDQVLAYNNIEKIGTTPEVAAVKAIQDYFGKELYGVIATELGGANTAVALDAAARIGKPIIDADPAGRSVPCLQHTTYFLNDVPIYPMSIANVMGDVVIVPKTSSDERAEAIARSLAVASFNHVGVVDHPNEWKVLKNALILDTISYCLEIGEIARKAQEENTDAAQLICDRFDGRVMFTGTVKEATWEDRDGFTYGEVLITGDGDLEGDELKIWFQNENMMSWKNGEVFITTPDSINILNRENNMPVLNPFAKVGMSVSVFALKAFKEWRTDKGIEILGPKFFGYNHEYVKMEEII